jgi:hypothetical protein
MVVARALVMVALLGCGSAHSAPPQHSPIGAVPSTPLRPSVPPARVLAFNFGWHCIKSADLADMSTCFKTAEQCTLGREKWVAAGMHYSGCLPQKRAACFSYHSKLQALDTFDCSATIAACEKQRAYATNATRDVEDVHDCNAWD